MSDHDWRRRRGDVLRALYETFVPAPDRKVFGEFYTPDWLAAMMVEQVLDDEWLNNAIQQAEVALLSRMPLKGVGVLDPACGSGTFLYHAALRMLEAPAMQGLTATQKGRRSGAPAERDRRASSSCRDCESESAARSSGRAEHGGVCPAGASGGFLADRRGSGPIVRSR